MRKLFRQFSFPGGIPSHVAPETPGSLHEGGELGYALSHAYGAAFDNPDLLVCCIVGDGEAETGPLATGWHGNKFLNPVSDGAVLPILHLNGYKIANPTVLARIGDDELTSLLEGYGYEVHWVSGDDPAEMHQFMAATLDTVIERVTSHPACGPGARGDREAPLAHDRPAFAQGLDRPQDCRRAPHRGHVAVAPGASGRGAHQPRAPGRRSSRGCAATGPRSCSMKTALSCADLAALPPKSHRRMSANPHSNGGLLLRDLALPDFRQYGVPVASPGPPSRRRPGSLGSFLRDVMTANPSQFRLFGPDEVASNRLQARSSRSPTGSGRPSSGTPTTIWPPRAGSWKCFPSTSARAGWRATC